MACYSEIIMLLPSNRFLVSPSFSLLNINTYVMAVLTVNAFALGGETLFFDVVFLVVRRTSMSVVEIRKTVKKLQTSEHCCDQQSQSPREVVNISAPNRPFHVSWLNSMSDFVLTKKKHVVKRDK